MKMNMERIIKISKEGLFFAKNFCKEHKFEVTASSIAIGLGLDDILQRIERRRERKAYEKSAIKFQAIMRMHEAEIQEIKSTLSISKRGCDT